MGLTAGQVKAWGARWENRFADMLTDEEKAEETEVLGTLLTDMWGTEGAEYLQSRANSTQEKRQKAISDMATAFALALHGLGAAKANIEAEKASEGVVGLLGMLAQDDRPMVPDFVEPQKSKKAKSKSRKIFGWDFPVQDGR